MCARWQVFEIGGPLKEEAAARREVELLKALEHPNVVSYKGACLEARGHLLLVMVRASVASPPHRNLPK